MTLGLSVSRVHVDRPCMRPNLTRSRGRRRARPPRPGSVGELRKYLIWSAYHAFDACGRLWTYLARVEELAQRDQILGVPLGHLRGPEIGTRSEAALQRQRCYTRIQFHHAATRP